MTLFRLYLIIECAMSLLTFIFFAIDKKLSGKESNGRIPEIVLLSLSTFCGAAGGFLGMYALRHKTNFVTKFHFAITVWLSLILQVGIAVWLFTKGGF